MELEQIQKYLKYVIYLVSGVLIFLLGLSLLVIEAKKKPPEERARIIADYQNQSKNMGTLPKPWPPQMNEVYPDFDLVDQEGKAFKLSDYRGKVLLIETIDMTSPISQSYNGAGTYGVLGASSQKMDNTVMPLDTMVEKYSEGKIKLPHPNIIVIKILFYNSEVNQPTPDDAARWAEHFKLTKANNYIVAVPDKDMRGILTSRILPGYQLIDRTFNLRVDAAGLQPKHSLTMTLIPLIGRLI